MDKRWLVTIDFRSEDGIATAEHRVGELDELVDIARSASGPDCLVMEQIRVRHIQRPGLRRVHVPLKSIVVRKREKWMVEMDYRTEYGTATFYYGVEELNEISGIVKLLPDELALREIRVRRNSANLLYSIAAEPPSP